MKMPRFTAEASAYVRSNTYHSVYSANSNVQQIVAQIKCPPDTYPCDCGPKGCYDCCDKPSPPPKCGPCTQQCVDSNGNTFKRNC